MVNREVGKIYETQDYGMFKTLEGNRQDAQKRAGKIIESIRKNGYILSPICINEKNEVIDGQGRLFALECEGLPVHYYIAPGTGIDDCIAMNIYGTKWTMDDYITSFAERGNESYILLKQLKEKYDSFSTNIIIASVTGKNSYAHNNRVAIQSGNFNMDEKDYEKAIERLDYISNIKELVRKEIKGRTDYFYYALLFIYDLCPGDFDRKKVINKIEMLYYQVPSIADTVSALKAISEIYNYKLRTDKMYFDVEYDKYMCENVPGYTSKWSRRG